MTVPVTTSSETFTGIVDGVACACPFPVEDNTHLEVTYGADIVATLGVHYTVTLYPPLYDHADVVPLAGFAVLSGGTINVQRNVPVVQTLDIPPLAEIASSRLEQGLDYLTFIATYLRDILGRTITYRRTDPASSIGPMPSYTERAGKLLGFDAMGKLMAATVVATAGTIFSAFGLAWVQTASAANALLTLGFTTVGNTGKLVVAAATAAAARATLGAVGAGDDTAFTGANTHTGKEKFNKFIVNGGASFLPQGRLTLQAGASVMTAAQLAKTALLYTPHVGNLIPIYDGTDMIPTVFAEITTGALVLVANKNYDAFVWSDVGVVKIILGGAWNSDTVRSAATENDLVRVDGILTNLNAIAAGPDVNKGTWIGTVRSDAASQLNWQPGGTAAGGTAALLNVWNTYNRVDVSGVVGDTTNSWPYTLAVWRAANASTGLRASFVYGTAEDEFTADYVACGSSDSGGTLLSAGVGYDSIVAPSGRFIGLGGPANNLIGPSGKIAVQPIGFHFANGLEYSQAVGTSTWLGDNGGTSIQTGLSYHGRF